MSYNNPFAIALATIAIIDSGKSLDDFLLGTATWLRSTDGDSDGLSVRDADDIRDRQPPKVSEPQARMSLDAWAKAHEAQVISDAPFGDSVAGPSHCEWHQFGWEKSEIDTPWGVETKWDFVLKDHVYINNYQAPDGLARCTQRDDIGALCDAVLDPSGHCPDCGFSTIWTEEVKVERENAKEIDRLERRMAKSLNAAYKAERFQRLSKIRYWFAAAPLDVIESARSRFYKRVIASRKLAAKTGLWYRQYLTKAEVDTVFAVIDYRLDGGEAIGTGAPTATPAPDAPKARGITVFSDNMTTAQAQWALNNRPNKVEHHNLSKAEMAAHIAKVQVAWPEGAKPLTITELESKLITDSYRWGATPAQPSDGGRYNKQLDCGKGRTGWTL
jgi:hypothetical protein